ncbi:Pentatricopeptide repeat-containing protein At4g16390 chloroplastic [Euphorbia peplus]|nr:Pentatricopeptide repeat-containing protein At4g16390 chloroplastic [Euphorbia peplus]
MAYNLCSSPSSLYQPLCNSLSSSREPKPRNLNSSFRLTSPQLQSKPQLQITHVSLQDPITEQPLQDPTFSSPKDLSSKSYIWVNPNSPRASQLRKRSYESRYAFLVKMAESLNSCPAVEEDVFEVLRGLGDRVLNQDAVVVLNNMSNPDTGLIVLKYFIERLDFDKKVILYNVTLKVFRKCRDLGRAEKLFYEMLDSGIRPDNITFSTLISCSRMSNLPEKAVEWYEKMPTFGLNPDDVTYAAMIDAYGRVGNIEMALSLYDRAREQKWRIDAVTFSTLIKIYGVSGNFDGCLNVYEEMKALAVKPNLVVFNTLLDAMGRAKRPWQAKKIYRDMIDNGFTPSHVTYGALLRAYCRARYGEDALFVYKEMKEKGIGLNGVLYNTLLAMCADLGKVSEALEIFEEMKNSGADPDSWTYSSMITIFSCSGEVSKAEGVLNDMLESGCEPNIFVLTSIIQCYGKAQRTDDVVRTFNQLVQLGIAPDERFCGCLLNVMTQTPKEELHKLAECIEKAHSKLGIVVRLLISEEGNEMVFKEEAAELFNSIGAEVKKAFCNCLIDLCINLDMLEKACELLDLGLTLEIYTDLQSKSSTLWSLHLKSLSTGAALTALHVWMNDLSKAHESGEELPPLLGINTGHGKHKYSDKGLAAVFESHLKELNAPFHESSDKAGWFLTTKVAAESFLVSRKAADVVAV